jgi:hypothetical protein
MTVYKVTPVELNGLQITRNGSRVEGTPLFWKHEREMAEVIANAMNTAFDAGKAAQKLETETPILAALCA